MKSHQIVPSPNGRQVSYEGRTDGQCAIQGLNERVAYSVAKGLILQEKAVFWGVGVAKSRCKFANSSYGVGPSRVNIIKIN